MTFTMRRTRVHLSRLVMIALVVCIAVVATGALQAGASAVVQRGAQQMLADALPASQTALVQASWPSTQPSIEEPVSTWLDENFADAPVQTTIVKQTIQQSGERGVELLAIADIGSFAELESGNWPAAADEVAIVSALAAHDGLKVGDSIVIEKSKATIVGIWHAVDAADAVWQQNARVQTGGNQDAVGPVIVTEDGMRAVSSTPTINWVVRLADAGSAANYQQALSNLTLLRTQLDAQGTYSLRFTDTATPTVTRLLLAAAAGQSVALVPLLLFLIIAGLLVGVLVVALQIERRAETRLLRARGAATVTLAGHSAAEGAATALIGAGLGLAVIAVGVPVVLGEPLPSIAVVIALGAVVAVAIVAALATITQASMSEQRRGGEAKRLLLVLVLPTVLVVVLALLATVQLLARGSFVLAGRPDPLAAAAPALLLLAGAALAPAIAGPLSMVAAWIAARGRGIIPVLAFRQVSRRMTQLALAVLCIALAGGSLVLGGVLGVGLQAAAERAVIQQLGATLRVTNAPAPAGQQTPAIDAAALGELAGARAVGVTHLAIAVGEQNAQFVAADTNDIANIAHTTTSLVAKLSGFASDATLTITSVTSEFDLDFELPPGETQEPTYTVTAMYLRADGSVRTAEPLVATLREADAGLTIPASEDERLVQVSVTAQLNDPHVFAIYSQIALSHAADTVTTEMNFQFGTEFAQLTAPGAMRLPIAISTALADKLNISVGDELEVRFTAASRTLSATVQDIVPEIDGTGAFAVAADTSAYTNLSLIRGYPSPEPNQAWIDAADPDAAAKLVQAGSPVSVVTETAATQSAQPITQPMTVLIALSAALAALLALIGAFVTTRLSMRARQDEIVPLRSLGMTRAMQRSSRAIEVIATAIFGLALGVAAAIGVAAVILPIVREVLG